MTYPLIVLIISFFLDGFITSYIPYSLNNSNIFFPYLTILTIVIIYPYFKFNHKKYFIILGIIGFIYDIVYAHPLLLNSFLFIIIGIITTLTFKLVTANIVNTTILCLIILFIYHFLTITILNIIDYFESYNVLTYKFFLNTSFNLVYAIILYLLIDLIGNKLHIKRLE